jgi:hypothetical protein
MNNSKSSMITNNPKKLAPFWARLWSISALFAIRLQRPKSLLSRGWLSSRFVRVDN